MKRTNPSLNSKKRTNVSLNSKQDQLQKDELPNIPIQPQYSPPLFRPASNNQGAVPLQKKQSTQSVTMQHALLEDDETRPSRPAQNAPLGTQVVRTTSSNGGRYLERTVCKSLGNGQEVTRIEKIRIPNNAPSLPPSFYNAQFTALRFTGEVVTTEILRVSDSDDRLDRSFGGSTSYEMEKSIRDFKLPPIIVPPTESPQQRRAQ